MIIKGSCRGGSLSDIKRLADHLLDRRGNEQVSVFEIRGVGATTLHEACQEMLALSLATRSRRPLYHASISPTADEARQMKPRHWMEAADELERRLGLEGHQRVLIRHDKGGRGHIHIVWNRCNSVTLKVAHDGNNYARHEACARALERRWRLSPVIGPHTRSKGIERPVAAINHKEHQAEVRTGISVAQVAVTLRQAWDASTDGRGFSEAVQAAGMTLAVGRRGVVVLDRAGTPHAIPRRLGIKAALVRTRLADIDITRLASVDAAKAAQKRHQPKRNSIMKASIHSSGIKRPVPVADLGSFWAALGFAITEDEGVVLVALSSGAVIEDRGDRLTLSKAGPPSEDETRIMIEAARARGWSNIRISGGTEEWQRQARLEAIRQGVDPARISIECEDHLPPLPALVPEHIRRRLTGKTPNDATPALPAPALPTAPEYRL